MHKYIEFGRNIKKLVSGAAEPLVHLERDVASGSHSPDDERGAVGRVAGYENAVRILRMLRSEEATNTQFVMIKPSTRIIIFSSAARNMPPTAITISYPPK